MVVGCCGDAKEQTLENMGLSQEKLSLCYFYWCFILHLSHHCKIHHVPKVLSSARETGRGSSREVITYVISKKQEGMKKSPTFFSLGVKLPVILFFLSHIKGLQNSVRPELISLTSSLPSFT